MWNEKSPEASSQNFRLGESGKRDWELISKQNKGGDSNMYNYNNYNLKCCNSLFVMKK